MVATATRAPVRTGIPRDTLPITSLVGAVAGVTFIELAVVPLLVVVGIVLGSLGGIGFVVVVGQALAAKRRVCGHVELALAQPGYRWVVAAEVAALATGLSLLNTVFDNHAATIPWIGLVVGVHLVGLGRVWHSLRLEGLGAGVLACGLAGMGSAITGGTEESVAVVSGMVPGFLLLATSSVALRPTKVPCS